ncbi:MAG: hypothetical protein ABSA71_16455 [Desulfomonilia bacterium]|jgi:hypothetical protein
MTLTIKYSSVVLFLALFFSTVQAANLYVDRGGHQATWDGTNGHTYTCSQGTGKGYSTIHAAVTAMASGDDVYIRGGTYNENEIYLGSSVSGTSGKYSSIQSYPGEWAIIDAQYAGTGNNRSVIWYAQPVSYIKFERLEITGGGEAVPTTTNLYGAGIMLYGASHITMRYLYIHDNYAMTNVGASAGIHLANGGGNGGGSNIIIEYCYLKGNGNPLPPGNANANRNTANAQIAIYSDYIYGTAPVNLTTCTHNNIIRYNLLDGSAATGGNAFIGFMHKASQRLTGWTYGETGNAADYTPNDTTGRPYGDDIEHNIIINSPEGMRLQQDYVQAHHNIMDLTIGTDLPGPAVETRDFSSDARGLDQGVLYNNTILAGGQYGFSILVPAYHWDCNTNGTSVLYDYTTVLNNIIGNTASTAVNGVNALVLGSGEYNNNCTGTQPITRASNPSPVSSTAWRQNFSRNLFYNCANPAFSIGQTSYPPSQLVSLGVADYVWASSSSPFVGSSRMNKYITMGSYALDGSHTIANGGLGGSHPYLSGVTLPSYVGAVNPNDNSWVAGVLGLNATYFISAVGGSVPAWIEGGGGSVPSTPPTTPTGLSIKIIE